MMPTGNTLRPVWAEINLNNFKKNIHVVRSLIPETCHIMAVVKANAYGIGAIPASQAALEAGAEWLAVATPDEGVEILEALPGCNLLVLGPVTDKAAEVLINLGASLTVTSIEGLLDANDAGKRLGKKGKVHIKIDTGMGRIGFRPGDELEQALDTVTRCDNLEVQGVFTHFAVADVDPEYTETQLSRFDYGVNQLSKKGIRPRYVHAANSAGILAWPKSHYDLVRPGIMLYGCYPNQSLADKAPLYPVLSLKARISHVKPVSAGMKIGYGITYETQGDTVIATVPIGYADGYRRALSNKGWVLIGGKRYPIAGRICMDQLMVDVGEGNNVHPGDVVTLIGQDGEECVTLDEVANLVETITHEILTGITCRVPRIYV